MYLLSICIPTFNRAKNLKAMLDSIKPHSNIEIVICDDGSTDKTREVVMSFIKSIILNIFIKKIQVFQLQ